MQGREAGTSGHDRGTAFLAAEARRLGLEPAGENGTYFQSVPLHSRRTDPSVALSVDGDRLVLFDDYTPVDQQTRVRSVDGARVVFGGTAGLDAERVEASAVEGAFVVVMAGAAPMDASRLSGAAGVGLVLDDPTFAEYTHYLWRTNAAIEPVPDMPAQPVLTLLSGAAARRLLGADPTTLAPGAVGGTLHGDIRFAEESTPSRNVVAILRGTDARLRNEYVAMGAHSDHDGIRYASVAHDSLRVALWRADRDMAPPEAGTMPARRDSIFNGADDDGTGSMGLLEVAEWLAHPSRRPKRSVLFVWHTGEEKGMLGSGWYTDHPTVPLDRIVAQINLDMIGRGSAADIEGGGADYLQVLGWRRLSTELGDLVERVNDARAVPFRFDTQFDAPGHPENYYCRSDHWMYARYGIPVAFFSTGDHPDYHQLTDEPDYIDYDHFASVTGFLGEVVRTVADLDHRPRVDGPKPDPTAPCRQ
jgi:hypothetical protein